MWINRCDRNTYVGVGERRMKMKKKFRLGGIGDIMELSLFLSVGYLLLSICFNFPLVNSNISEVFATFCLLVPSIFVGLSVLELFWFERDLTWSGGKPNET